MVKKRNRSGRRARNLLDPRRVEQLLLATTFPRLHMALILALAAVGAFSTSALLVALGVHTMGLRYAAAAVGGYAFFLLLVRLWIAYTTRNWSFGRNTSNDGSGPSDLGGVDLPDLSSFGGGSHGGGGGGELSGGGGNFGGAGASGSFGDAVTKDGSSSSLLEAVDVDGEWVVVVIALVALLGAVVALGLVIYSSPLLLAEVLLDVAVVGALYRKNQRHERRHWAAGVLRRTYKAALVLAVSAAVFGFAVQSLAPEQHTLGAVLAAHHDAND